jgi:trans-2,3-dihydro-3-hydroxyanthranilate isomerase
VAATHQFVIADVFTDTPLSGNQLAVFTDATAVPDDLLQLLALEIGFAETVFVYPPTADEADARIRIFTPGRELPFAGHPVLGTAYVLAAERGNDRVVLETGRGLVPVAFGASGRGRMVQPVPTVEPYDTTDGLLFGALGVEGSELPVDIYDNGVRHAYVVLPVEADVQGLEPDIGGLARVMGDAGTSCIAGRGDRWTTRMFAPGVGVAEDAATGSAAGPLAVHLARHGVVAWGTTIEIHQGAAIGRPSVLFATAEGGPDGPTRVEVAGDTVLVGRGEFTL